MSTELPPRPDRLPTQEEMAAEAARATVTGEVPDTVIRVTPSRAELERLPDFGKFKATHSSLSTLQREYVLFTHALLFTEGGFQSDPLQEWMLARDQAGRVIDLQLPRKLFRGLGVYDTHLYACPLGLWAGLAAYLNSVTGVDVKTKRYAGAFLHDAVVPDIGRWPGGWPTARVTIKVVGLTASFGLYSLKTYPGFVPAPFGWLGEDRRNHRAVADDDGYLPRVRRDPPEPETLSRARTLLGDLT